MAYQVKFTVSGEQTLTVEKAGRAKIVTEALNKAGISTSVTVNKVVDFNAPKKPRTKKPSTTPKPKK